MTSAQKRWQISEQEAKRLFGFQVGGNEGKVIDAEFCTDPDYLFRSHTTEFKMLDGAIRIKNWIANAGLERCRMKESTCLLTVGQKVNGCFVSGKYKTYWLRPKP